MLCALALPVRTDSAEPNKHCPQPLQQCLAEQRHALAQRGVLGFLWAPVTPSDSAPPKARFVVRGAPAGYPAASAGLKSGDFLLTMAGKEVGQESMESLAKTFAAVKVGARVVCRVWRQGREVDVPIVAAQPTGESIEAWIGQHVKDYHSQSDYRTYLRALQKSHSDSKPQHRR